MKRDAGRVHVGTSGYSYDHWKRLFYPKGLAGSGWLGFYAQVFSTLELNATFYRLPSPEAVSRWKESVPEGFRFAAKGSRFLTHMKRLTDFQRGLTRFYAPLRQLGSKLTVVLWQLPPQMNKPDPERLDRFLSGEHHGIRQAVEFRSDAWYHEEICAVLDAHGAAFCEHDLVAKTPPRITGGFRYLRFHGATGKYSGRYGRRGLRGTARALNDWKDHGDAFVYFNNDLGGHAIADALELMELLEPKLPRAFPHLPAAPA